MRRNKKWIGRTPYDIESREDTIKFISDTRCRYHCGLWLSYHNAFQIEHIPTSNIDNNNEITKDLSNVEWEYDSGSVQ